MNRKILLCSRFMKMIQFFAKNRKIFVWKTCLYFTSPWAQSKESVQGTCDSDSTCLYLVIAKPNMKIKTKKLSIIWLYLALIYKAEIPYLPQLYLNHEFLITFFLVQRHKWQNNVIKLADLTWTFTLTNLNMFWINTDKYSSD